jgi:hypothetical protein
MLCLMSKQGGFDGPVCKRSFWKPSGPAWHLSSHSHLRLTTVSRLTSESLPSHWHHVTSLPSSHFFNSPQIPLNIHDGFSFPHFLVPSPFEFSQTIKLAPFRVPNPSDRVTAWRQCHLSSQCTHSSTWDAYVQRLGGRIRSLASQQHLFSAPSSLYLGFYV